MSLQVRINHEFLERWIRMAKIDDSVGNEDKVIDNDLFISEIMDKYKCSYYIAKQAFNKAIFVLNEEIKDQIEQLICQR
jgi:hypothetical protein